jgi:hypothetical protein
VLMTSTVYQVPRCRDICRCYCTISQKSFPLNMNIEIHVYLSSMFPFVHTEETEVILGRETCIYCSSVSRDLRVWGFPTFYF